MAKVEVSFIDGTNQIFDGVADMDVKEHHYVIHFEKGPLTFVTKRNVFTVAYSELSEQSEGA